MITENMISTALRYIGIPKATIDVEMNDQVLQGFKKLEEIALPKITYQKVKINRQEDKIVLEGTNCSIQSQDLIKLFKNSHECILMAATLGREVDRQIANLQKTNMLVNPKC